MINQSLWKSNQLARDRQQKLSWAVRLMDLSLSKPVASEYQMESCPMVPAIVLSEYYRRQKQIDLASYWMHVAIQSDPSPNMQEPIVLPGWIEVTLQGNLKINWDPMLWRLEQSAVITHFSHEGSLLTISYANNKDTRDEVIYAWYGNLPTTYWNTLEFEAWIETGTYLTFEIYTDKGFDRSLSYYQGKSQTERFTFPILGDEIYAIYISLSEPPEGSDASEYRLIIEPVQLLIDQAVGKCK